MHFCIKHNRDDRYPPDEYEPACLDCWARYFGMAGIRAVTGEEMELFLKTMILREELEQRDD